MGTVGTTSTQRLVSLTSLSANSSAALGSVKSLTGGINNTCALLDSGGVDCWGSGYEGELGDGAFTFSAVPVQVLGVGGTGTLSGVAALTNEGAGFCARLSAGGVDCWGEGIAGELGNGAFNSSAVPVQVLGMGGTGTLSGVNALTSGGFGICARLTAGGVDCWGYGANGNLGDGNFYTTGNYGSAVPVQVLGVGGIGTLSGVQAVTSDGGGSFCARLSAGGIECWGYGGYGGQLGDGSFNSSAVPVQVLGVGGTGTLSGMAVLTGAGDGNGYCALLTSGGVACWGYGYGGELGNGIHNSSAVPVQVLGVGGTGMLSGVQALTGYSAGDDNGYCARLTAGGVDCWGYGGNGELGDGAFKSSAVPVQVLVQMAPTDGVPTPQSFYGGKPFCWACAANAVVQGVGSAIHAIFGSPVDTETGNMYDTQTDMALPGRGIPLVISRTYNSQAAASEAAANPPAPGPFGYGWSTNLGASLQLPAAITNGSTITLVEENGAQTVLTYNGTGWTAPPRVTATLSQNTDGTWKLVRHATQILTFLKGGQVTSTTDLNGHGIYYHYTGTRLTSISDSASRSLTIGWDPTGSHITSVTDTNVTPNRIVTYAYTGDDLTDVTDVNGGDTHFTYLNHLMTAMSDPKCTATAGCPGIVTHYDSSTPPRVDYQSDQLGRKTTFAYSGTPDSASGGTTLVTDPTLINQTKGNETLETYQYGLKVAETEGYGTTSAATTYYLYDPNSLQATQITDPNGNITSLTYDTNGNLLTKTDPLGHTTSYTYTTPLNETRTSTDPNGVETTNSYDGTGNLTSATIVCSTCATPITQTTDYTVCELATCSANGTKYLLGDVESVTDPMTKITTYAYDTYGDRTKSTDPLGHTSTVTYNADGWKLTSVSPKGNVTGCNCASKYTTKYSYLQKATNTIDGFGDVQSVKDPLRHVTQTTYDADRNTASTTDPDSNPPTTYTYDLANEQTQVQRPDHSVLVTDFNLDGTVADQKNGKGIPIETYGYDSLKRVTSMTDADGNTTSYTYDPVGNRLSVQQPTGTCAAMTPTGCTSYTYDTASELTSITYSDGTTPNVTNITYDKDGHRTGMSDGTGAWSWTYDALNRLSTVTEGTNGTVTYGYNLRGDVTSITYPGYSGTHVVTRTYDDAGRWTGVTDWLSNTTLFGYDANNNLTSETFPTGTGEVDNFRFNNADQMKSIVDKAGTSTLFSAAYTRDNNGQLTRDTSQSPTNSSYAYTGLNQLCYASSSATSPCNPAPPGSQAYGYNSADNLVSDNGTTQAFDPADRLCWTAPGASAGGCGSPPTIHTSYKYDDNGNLTTISPSSGTPTTLGYDQANRLTTYSGTAKASYQYNGDGVRMSKETYGLIITSTPFTWDFSTSVPLLLTAGYTHFIYGPEGLPVEQLNGPNLFYFHHDQLGSTRALTNSTGASVASYSYDPYGNTATSTGTAANPFLYSGQYTDAESGLQYLRARYYDPKTAQFVSVDPLNAVTRSPYGYVGGSPLNGTDPSGLDLCWAGVGLGCPPTLPPGECDTQAWGAAIQSGDQALVDYCGAAIRIDNAIVAGVKEIAKDAPAVATAGCAIGGFIPPIAAESRACSIGLGLWDVFCSDSTPVGGVIGGTDIASNAAELAGATSAQVKAIWLLGLALATAVGA
jgi:RHS repeat-associated protein